MKLNYDQVDSFVDKLEQRGSSIYWENYTLCIFVPDDRGRYHTKGRLLNGYWGIEHRFEVDDEGYWTIPKVFIKGVRNA